MGGQPVPSSFEDNTYVCSSTVARPNNRDAYKTRGMRVANLPPQSSQFREESGLQKFTRRLKEEPLIPLGCAATCYALYRAYRSMKVGDSVEMNRMFRARIYAQAFTLVSLVVGGMYFKSERQQRREFEKAVEVRKSQEKRDAWLRELEIRDKEDREWRERHAAIEAAAKEAGTKEASPKEAPKPQEPHAARAAIEPGDEKKLGVVDAVRALLSRG
ncbi:Altered inheritance of mitochondria protein 31 mitochondrial [Penicillium capsulatum]|uniref:Altered inheritance of mitochondria protein 31 mitochondrial n=1 Tax=Penicillium capsulatum TaxID=69766 RepID=A0A9W9HUM8_9EURO|nr:Altered inheritance of mitochondria protein 31 mitochondrial [Penicillium capsulatum]KAJ6106892.1 Altered inheritance of mitochondria protein 31 mitochondrial [Penicillium capsulatum]